MILLRADFFHQQMYSQKESIYFSKKLFLHFYVANCIPHEQIRV